MRQPLPRALLLSLLAGLPAMPAASAEAPATTPQRGSSAAICEAEAAADAPECKATALPAVRSEAPSTDPLDAVARSRIDGAALRVERPGFDLSEALQSLPGISARPRYNEAQDTQISIRGFGARTQFGVRGLRLDVDGISATAADGQTQIGHIDLSAIDRIELIRGPLAALYANGGGYLRIESFGARWPDGWRLGGNISDIGNRRAQLAYGWRGEAQRGQVQLSDLSVDGQRRQSGGTRRQYSAMQQWQHADLGEWSLSANLFDAPDAADPQGLNRAEFRRNPEAASPAAVAFNTRKSTAQQQAGLRWRLPQTSGEWTAAAYAGQREVEQYLSVTPAAQQNPTSGGGVVDLKRDFAGLNVGWQHEFDWAAQRWRWSGEWRFDRLDEDRRGYENFVGTTLGLRGALRRDERNRGDTRDAMMRLDWDGQRGQRLTLGARHHRIAFRSDDRYVAPGNPDDSGSYQASAWLPVLAYAQALGGGHRWVASVGRNVEMPTLAELAFRPDGDGGFNRALEPARSEQAELGWRWAQRGRGAVELSLFQVDTEQEIVVQQVIGGRASFQNAGRTRRQGAELGWRLPLASQGQWQTAATWIDASFTEGYAVCQRTPCITPDRFIAAGNDLPGVAPRQIYSELSWRSHTLGTAALEWRALSATQANDLNDEKLPGYAVFGLRWTRALDLAGGEARLLLRIDNLLDRRYSASLVVNEGARRFYEPAPGRSYSLGFDWRW